MKKDIETLRREKEREEERKILQAINEQNKRARARREEQKERARKEREQKKEDRKTLIQCITLILVMILLLGGLLKLANDMDQDDFKRCQENGGSVEYCQKVIEW